MVLGRFALTSGASMTARCRPRMPSIAPEADIGLDVKSFLEGPWPMHAGSELARYASRSRPDAYLCNKLAISVW